MYKPFDEHDGQFNPNALPSANIEYYIFPASFVNRHSIPIRSHQLAHMAPNMPASIKTKANLAQMQYHPNYVILQLSYKLSESARNPY